MQRTTRLSPALAGLLVAALALIGSAPPETKATDQLFSYPPPAPAADAKKPDEKKDKPFDEVVKDMEKIEGLFTFYRDKEENKVMVELGPGQFDKDFIFSSKVEQATGEKGLYGTIMGDQYVFQWRRLGKRIQFVQKNIRFRAQAGSPAARAVEKSFSDSVLSSGKIQSLPHPERKSVLVDLAEIFLASDLHGFGPYLKQVYKTGYQFDKDNSGFLMVKSFPQNAELGAQVRFTGQEFPQGGSVAVTDPRYLTLRFRYSLLEAPQNDYVPRLADDRVGYFVDQYMDFTSDRPDTPYVRYINRWRLKKKDPKAAVSEPVEPLVFWLENSIPQEYREPIREGILMWNAAFEKAGLKNAVVVKQQPDDADWDPADIRYNTIRWFAGYDATFAIGPSHSNPYTGQLLDADIGISEGILRLGARRRYQLYINPVVRVRELAGELPGFPVRPGFDPRTLCNYGDGLAEQASMALDVLAARPDWNPEKEKEFVRQYVMELLAHEVGHTLGLRHNFRASIVNRMDQLGDTQRTHTVGLAASVMDYNPAIVALKGEKQGDYLPIVVGSYDQWAIEYGYKPIAGAKTSEDELPELRKVAMRAADPLLPYGTDEDTYFGARVIDPRNYPYDFTDQPLTYFTHEYKVVRELWTNMEAKLVAPGDSYEILRRAFDYTWSPYVRGTVVAAKYIGGIYHNRDHAGDPNGRPPYVPAPAAEQRRALEFLAREIWGPDVFRVQADLLNKLQIERLQSFEALGWTSPRLDYPLHDWVLAVQGESLGRLYDPIRLARLQDLEMKYPNPNDRFTMADLFTGVRQAVWSELDSGANSNSFRRNLQRAHLRYLMAMLLKPAEGTPEDAVTLARADLLDLKGKIDRALSGGQLDAINRAHLDETRARIQQALDAQVTRGL